MKILFLTDNFPPEYNAPASRTFEHCKELVRLGAEVTIITCFPNFPSGKIFEGYKNSWRKVEYIEGIKVIRVWSYVAKNSGVFNRTLDFLSFSVTSFLSGIFMRCDVIIATSPQFFTAVSGCAIGILRRKKWIMEVRDIWPESIKAVEAVSSNLIISFLEKIEKFLYRSAHKIIVVTDSFQANLMAKGVSKEKIFVVKNGVDLTFFQPRKKDSELISKLDLKEKFVIGYIGTHGMAHGLDFILHSIKSYRDESVQFIFIGDGAVKQSLINLSLELELKNVTFLDPISKSEVPRYLSIIDVALVPLRKTVTFESVIPSKIFESVAMNVPILLGVNGESKEIIESYGAGLYFEPENMSDFHAKLAMLKHLVLEQPARFAENCQKMACDFNRVHLAKKLLDNIT